MQKALKNKRLAKPSGADTGDGVEGAGAQPNPSPEEQQRVAAGAAIRRLTTDLVSLENSESVVVDPPTGDRPLEFEVRFTPQCGYWKGAQYRFKFSIPESYPNAPPRCSCLTRIYHPNIDLEGNVCLNILREAWTPIGSIQHVLLGIELLFKEPPNTDSPLNQEAARQLRQDERAFKNKVNETLRGGTHFGYQFETLVRR
eukprot:GHVN01103152.1.p1 GENE.GHVN01103152.1~~GHVN01103152.1.p1  ORF type:complete len:200 (+),score=34.56 GHVN01103152.1:201-800(+)